MIRNDDMHNCHSKSRNNCFDKWIAYVISYVRKRFDAIETKLGTESEIPYQVNFSVSDYFEKVERIACEQDNAFIPVELWWGCDGMGNEMETGSYFQKSVSYQTYYPN